MQYIVWYHGEYDVDKNGELITVHKVFDSYEEAVKSAEDWEKATNIPAHIEEVLGEDYYDAIDAVNAAYDAEDFDRYESLLENFSCKFGIPLWQFEDNCTDVRMYGREAC